ncbi:MAG: WD40 repeat domain-containing protein [Anaerolineaceae bacterium]
MEARAFAGSNSSTADFNSTSNRIATSLLGGQAGIFRLPGFEAIGASFPTLSPDVIRADYGAGERTLFTRPAGGVIEQWDLTGAGLVTAYSYDSGAGRAAVAPDGSWFVKQAPDGSWSRWSLPGLTLLNRSAGSTGPPGALYRERPVPVAVSSDSRSFATVHGDCPTISVGCAARVIVWDAASGKPIGEPIAVPNPSQFTPGVLLAFHPTQPLIALSLPANRVQVWQVGSTSLTLKSEFAVRGPAEPLVNGWSYEIAFVPRAGNEPLLMVYDSVGFIQFWDIAASPPVAVITTPTVVPANLGVTPGGVFVIERFTGEAKFFEPEALGKADPKPLLTLQGVGPAAQGPYVYFSFSADGKRMAVVRGDALISPPGEGIVEVWDLEKQEKIGSTFAAAGPANAAWISADGSKVTVVSDQAVVIWDLDTAKWPEKVCFAAGRNLTEAEWTKYFPGREYEVTCSQWTAKPKT